MRTGRHPSRTLILVPTDPDGPSWLEGGRPAPTAWCPAPTRPRPAPSRSTSPPAAMPAATSRRSSRHSSSTTCPVTVWWPGDPPFGRPRSPRRSSATADRLVVDGSHWSGDGLDRLAALAALAALGPAGHVGLPISDFALMRQARWREAVASVFDRAELLPYLGSLRRIAVTMRRTAGRAPRRRRTSSSRSTTSPGSRRGSGCTLSARSPGSSARRQRDGRAPPPGHRPTRGAGCGRAWPAAGRAGGGRDPAGRSPSPRPARRCASSCSPSGAAPSCGRR